MAEQPLTMVEIAVAMMPGINDNLASNAPPGVPPTLVWMTVIADYMRKAKDAFTVRDLEAWRNATITLTAAAIGLCADTESRLDEVQRQRTR